MSAEKDIEKIQKLVEKGKSEKIEKYLKDKDKDVVKAAITGLGQIQDETAVNLLSKLIEDQDPDIRKTAVVAFSQSGSEYSKTFIQHLAAVEKDDSVKEVIMQTLQKYKFK